MIDSSAIKVVCRSHIFEILARLKRKKKEENMNKAFLPFFQYPLMCFDWFDILSSFSPRGRQNFLRIFFLLLLLFHLAIDNSFKIWPCCYRRLEVSSGKRRMFPRIWLIVLSRLLIGRGQKRVVVSLSREFREFITLFQESLKCLRACAQNIFFYLYYRNVLRLPK